uniref:Uncharacterized protein n=1 Tax=viral metagenome TaxID=1070528 RepID=A0A6M3IF92_9ZZZZ
MRDYEQLTQQELELYQAKNKDYTNGGSPYGNFERVASILSLYPKLKLSDPRIVAMVYLMKQLDSCLWMLNEGYEGEVENIDTRLTDVHVYAKIIRLMGGNNE